MKHRTNVHTTYSLAAFGKALDLPIQPSYLMDFEAYLTNEKPRVVGYLFDDEDVEKPEIGNIYSSHRHSGTHHEMQQALALNSDWQPDTDLISEEVVVEAAHEEIMESFMKGKTSGIFSTSFLTMIEHCVRHRPELDKRLGEYTAEEVVGFLKSYFATENDLTPVIDLDVIRRAHWQEAWEAGTIGNPYAVSLDVYEHSSVSYSVAGEGPNCRFDTARGGAVWVPDRDLIPHITYEIHLCRYVNATEKDGKFEVRHYLDKTGRVTDAPIGVFKSRQEVVEYAESVRLIVDRENCSYVSLDLSTVRAIVCRELARQSAKIYTDWANGNCYGIVIAHYDEDGVLLDTESCGGYIGSDDALAALKEAFKEVTK